MTPSVGNTLPKSERICGKKSVGALLESGHWGSAGILKYCWTDRKTVLSEETDAVSGPRMMVSVSKKFFKRAVKRNLLKRRIRESYRLQKGILGGADVDVMFVYNSKGLAGFEEISSAVGEILESIGAKAGQDNQIN